MKTLGLVNFAVALSSLTASSLTAGEAGAGLFKDGNSLYEDCRSSDIPAQTGCLGFVVGVADTASALEFKYLCIPNGVTARQLEDIVTPFLRDHPEDRHWSASGLVLSALAKAFPCKPG
jgi:hypothetical protein